MRTKIISAAVCICIACLTAASADEAAYMPGHGAAVSAESLLVPDSVYMSEDGTRDISKWTLMETGMRRSWVKRVLLYGLSMYISGADSPERDFMTETGWTPKLACEALERACSSLFIENAVMRTDLSVREYIRRRDLIRSTVLCRSGVERCPAHEGMSGVPEPCDRCETFPAPSLIQIALYQCLMETVSALEAAGYAI